MGLCEEADTTLPLELVSSQTFDTGVLDLICAPDEAPPGGGYDEANRHLSEPSSRARSAPPVRRGQRSCGSVRSKYSTCPMPSCMPAMSSCSSGGISAFSPSRASASLVK
jgi:hypothetical protein